MGALSNHYEVLQRLVKLKSRLLAEAAERPAEASPAPLRHRSGSLIGVIRQIMAETKRPMNVREVQVLAEKRLGGSISRDSVNSCLSTGPEFQRVRRGWYRLD